MKIILLNEDGNEENKNVYIDGNSNPADIGNIILDMVDRLNDKEEIPSSEISKEEHNELIDEKIHQEIQEDLIHNDL